MTPDKNTTRSLREKAQWVRKMTLLIHKGAPGTRVASSLSCVEILTALYYGGLLKFDPRNPRWDGRDRLIISKGHGAVSLYPILADLGFFPEEHLSTVCRDGAALGGIPDTVVPGLETVNGSLGHGLGVGCGVALALRNKGNEATVFVLLGDGELYEGAVWESVMFAAQQKLDNLVLIIDNNKACILDFCKNIIDMSPLADKFAAFNWEPSSIDGHDVATVFSTLDRARRSRSGRPCVVIADTVKGKGVPRLETDGMSHIRSLTAQEVDSLVASLQ